MREICLMTRAAYCIALAAALSASSAGHADDVPGLGAIANHDHSPIYVRSRPVIERLPVKVIEPVDLVLSRKSHVFIADRKAECVFRLDEQGAVSFMIEGLPGIERIQLDVDNSLYVLTSTGGESSLHQVTPGGQRVVLQTFSFPASAFVRDEEGFSVIAVKNSGRLVSLSPEGEISDLSLLSRPALDLIHNAGGQLEALLSAGQIVRIDESGEAVSSGHTTVRSTRLSSLGDGHLLSLAEAENGRAEIVRVSREVERPDQFDVTATVPAGTRAVGFDSLGNLCLANPDLRAVTKVTSHFLIPCPHCNKPTQMIFRTDTDPNVRDDIRSF